MTAQDLKNSILQLAVEGKLLSRKEVAEALETTEGPKTGAELLEQIKAEKARLIAEGKIKKNTTKAGASGRALAEITEDEKPFDIPENWCWVRLRDICTKIVDGDHNPPHGLETKTDYIMASSQNINFDSLVELDKVRYLSEEVFRTENERTRANEGDVFFTSVGTLGRSCVYTGGLNICFQRSVSVITTLIFNKYLKYFLDSPDNQSFIISNATGTAQKGFYLNQLEKLVVPLPPLAEQKRIVAKIEELLPYIQKYDVAHTKLEEFNKKFPVDMQKSILQQAIMGKLTEDWRNEQASLAKTNSAVQLADRTSAKDLLKKIKAQKARLIAEGKIKKDTTKAGASGRALAEITEDEIPFDIPESWCWCRLGELVTNRSGLGYKKENLDVKTKDMIRVLRGGNIFELKYHQKVDDIFIDRSFVKEELLLKRNTLVTPAVTSLEHIGKMGRIEDDYSDMVVGGFVLMIEPFLNEDDFSKYLLYCLSSPWHRDYCKGITHKSGQAFYNLSREKLMEAVIPLPPLAEQKRIVAKIEELLPLCKKLVK